MTNGHYLNVLVLFDSVTRDGVGLRPYDCKPKTRSGISGACSRTNVTTRVERLTFGATSQTVKIPAGTTDDSPNDSVTIRDVNQSHPHNRTPDASTRCFLLSLRSGLRGGEGTGRRTRGTYIGIAYG